MKKIMLSLCLLIALSMSVEAQTRPHHPNYGYQHKKTVVKRPRPCRHDVVYDPRGEFRIHVLADMGFCDFGGIFMHEIPRHFSVGGMAEYQLGRATSVGIGVEFYSSYGERCRLFQNMQETYIHTLPIYANLRFAVPRAPVSPFIEGRVGYSAPLNTVTCNDPYGVHHYKSTGLYTGGAFGLKIFRANLSLGFSVIDVIDADQGVNGGRKDIITDYYVRLSYAF